MSKRPAGRHKEFPGAAVRPVRRSGGVVRPVRRRYGGLARTVTAATAAALVVGGAIVAERALGGTDVLDVPAQADTFVSSAHTSSGYDTAPSLWISARESNRRTAYLQFVVPSGASVQRAELVLTRDVHHFPATSVTVSRA